MKAIVCHKYGSPDVLKLEEVQKPAPLGLWGRLPCRLPNRSELE